MDGISAPAGPFVTEDRYHRLRQKLIMFFERRECFCPEELADESLQRVVQRVSRGPLPDAVEVEAFAMGIARNVILEWYRSPRYSTVAEVEAYNPEEAGPQDLADRAREAIATLDPEDKEMMSQYYLDGRAAESLAKEWGLSPEGIRSRIFRKRRKLIAWFAQNKPTGTETKASSRRILE